MSYTPDQIRTLLDKSDKAVERAVLHLYGQQKADEQKARFTKHKNGVGFNKRDAGYGSYLASWLKAGKHLNGKHVAKARHMVRKYAGQLAKAANAKASPAETPSPAPETPEVKKGPCPEATDNPSKNGGCFNGYVLWNGSTYPCSHCHAS